MAWVERDLKDYPVLTSNHGHRHPPVDQFAQIHIQPGLKYFQNWGIHNFSGQAVPASHDPHSKGFLCNISYKPVPFQFEYIPLILSLHPFVWSPSPGLLHTPFRCWKATIWSHWSLLFSWLKYPQLITGGLLLLGENRQQPLIQN